MRPFLALALVVATLPACAPPTPRTTSHKHPEVRPLTMPKSSTEGHPFEVAVFHGCYDGDTCTVSLPNSVPALFGDISASASRALTPEMKGMCEHEKALAKQAQALTQKLMVAATKIELLEPRRDKYFRILARVMADGQEVAQELVKQGLAVPYDGGKKKDWCAVPGDGLS